MEKSTGYFLTAPKVIIPFIGVRKSVQAWRAPCLSCLCATLAFGAGMFFFLFSLACAESKDVNVSSLVVSSFSQDKLEGWEEKEFAGRTSYRLTKLDGRKVLFAKSRHAASGLFRKMRVDLDKTPYLNWSWRVEQGLPPLDETRKEGDDYAARIYVVVDGGLFFWKTIAINYVWSSSQLAGSVWPNAFAGKNAMLMALRSSGDGLSVWYTEKRNLREDFKALVGVEIHQIDAVALMSDTDNSRGEAQAYYGEIYFTAE
jgi:hypothetical protein